MGGGYVLYGGQGTGAVAVEAALTLMGQAYTLVDAPATDTLAGVAPATPMRQVPGLTLPDGETMTESAAILLRLTELHPQAGLAPAVDDPRRSAFLRWLSFVSTQIYAHFWVKDDPARLIPGAAHGDGGPGDAVNASIEARISQCWAIMETGVTPGRYILGDAPTVLDLYVTVVSRFRPRRQRFYAAAPRMGDVVRRLDADPRLTDLWARRYPFFVGWDRM